MEVSGKLQAPAALPSGINPVPIEKRVVCTIRTVERCLEAAEAYLKTLLGIRL